LAADVKNQDIAVLDSGAFFGEQQLKHPLLRDQLKVIDVYDLPETDLTPFISLIIPSFIDQEFLLKNREQIRAFLDSRRVIVFSGNLFLPWLPGGKPFVAKEIHTFNDYAVSVVQPHPIFEGILPEDLTFKDGVAGFFARGHHPPPEGAEILLTLPDGEPIIYIDRNSTQGTILVHSGNDLLGYAGSKNTACQLVPQLLHWIRKEYVKLSRKEGDK
jgi:hypothetical protein